MQRHRLLVAVLVASGLLVAAPAAGAQARRGPAAPGKPKPFFDIRDAQASPRAPSAATRSARSRLRSAGAVVGVDTRTGSVRFLAGRAAPLSAAAAGDRRDLAESFLRGHLPALGLARGDLGSLRLERRAGIPGGALLLGYRQYADGIPSFEGGLRIVVDAHGRVASVTGPVQAGLSLASDVPRLTATDALRRVMASVGVQRSLRVASGPSGVRRETHFTSGEAAALVVFGEGTSAPLAWELDLRAGPAAHYAAVVDARTGQLLYRANRVKSAANDAVIWEQYPGAPNGGAAHGTDLTPYLNSGATDLSGPYAHAWSDTNDSDSGTTSSDGHIVPSDHPDAGEAVGRTGTGGSFSFAFADFTGSNG